MATTIAQIVYNLEDYHNSGGVIYTSENDFTSILTQLYRNVGTAEAPKGETYFVDSDGNETSNKAIDIYGRNIVKYGSKQAGDDENTELVGPSYSYIYKLGVQAPPGTVFYLSTARTPTESSYKRIMIGRSGIYELDDSIQITGLYFEQPYQYGLNDDATKKALDAGMDLLKTTTLFFDISLAALQDIDFINYIKDPNSIYPPEDNAALRAYYDAIQYLIDYNEETWENFTDLVKQFTVSDTVSSIIPVEEDESAAFTRRAMIMHNSTMAVEIEEPVVESDFNSNSTSPIQSIIPNNMSLDEYADAATWAALEPTDDKPGAEQELYDFDSYIENFEEKVNDLNFDTNDLLSVTDVAKDSEYWEAYDIVHDGYLTKYDQAYVVYQKGLNGIYQKTTPKEIKNLIIDYLFDIYETTEGGAV